MLSSSLALVLRCLTARASVFKRPEVVLIRDLT